jgi:hypothetical protein
MFLGHYGLAFAAKRVAPRTSLGALTFAAQFLDELWPILLLLGVEQVRIVPGYMTTSPLEFTSYPYSHSLLNSVAITYLLEVVVFLAGILFYVRATRGRDRIGRWGLWSYVLVLTLSFFGAGLGPPPPSVRDLAWSTMAIWIFVPWAWWVDKHRETLPFVSKSAPSQASTF